MSPGSEGLATAALEGEGWEGVGLAVASGGTLVLEATEELSQPFPPMATAAIKNIITRFISAISSLLRQPSPCLLPNPSEWRTNYRIAYGVPATSEPPEPPAVLLNSRSSNHSIACISASIFEYSTHQKILVSRVRMGLSAEALHVSFECYGRESVQLQGDGFSGPHEVKVCLRNAHFRSHAILSNYFAKSVARL